jgi:hypothetical protein
MRRVSTGLFILLFVLAIGGDVISAQCPNGRPCHLTVNEPIRAEKNNKGRKTKGSAKNEPKVPIDLSGWIPTTNPPSLAPPEHAPLPIDPDSGQKYVSLSVSVKDQHGAPWTNAEVGLSDDSRWVGNSVGFKFKSEANNNNNKGQTQFAKGQTQFTDVPCGVHLKLLVFYLDSDYPRATIPYRFTLDCRKPAGKMFFVLDRQ